MTSHFNVYVANFNRVRLGELIDYHETQSRIARARASLIINPLSREYYSGHNTCAVSIPAAAAAE